ncbi:delta DNA polymerase isoform X1 [Zea mays]|uniref:Delta DNA polymerase n=1 Tax=Zea mays TaxID=4577 RepID=A0A804RFM1_MAIZE|nr:delta DNA polymerase isoform X1 [Zea mays]|eukprot:XP_008661861.1 delta DNA polymerase isoform X1 [Zea mays]
MTRGGGGDMKSFFRQQKTHAAAATTKPTGGVSKKAAAHHHKKAALATNVHPAPYHGAGSRQQEEAEAEQRERAGREFDMDTRYGPCLGVTRAQRWRRAAALGLAPPPALLALCADEQPCLWEGRV